MIPYNGHSYQPFYFTIFKYIQSGCYFSVTSGSQTTSVQSSPVSSPRLGGQELKLTLSSQNLQKLNSNTNSNGSRSRTSSLSNVTPLSLTPLNLEDNANGSSSNNTNYSHPLLQEIYELNRVRQRVGHLYSELLNTVPLNFYNLELIHHLVFDQHLYSIESITKDLKNNLHKTGSANHPLSRGFPVVLPEESQRILNALDSQLKEMEERQKLVAQRKSGLVTNDNHHDHVQPKATFSV